MSDRLNEKEAADYCGFALVTFRQFRYDKAGPKHQLGGKAFYFKKDLDFWLNSRGTICKEGL